MSTVRLRGEPERLTPTKTIRAIRSPQSPREALCERGNFVSGLFPEATACCRITVNRTILDFDISLPREMVFPCRQIFHVSQPRILFSTGLGNVATAPKIEYVVFKTPGTSCLIGQPWVNLPSDDLPRITMSLNEGCSVDVAYLPLTKVIKYVIVSGKVDRDGVHEVVPRIRAIGQNPLLAYLGAVSRDPDVDIASLVSGLSGKFRYHPVMANTNGKLAACRSVANGHS